MELLNLTKAIIISLGRCKAAFTVSHAAAAACSQKYGVSLLRISAGLDYDNKQLVLRLLDIIREPDYSNAAQDEMLIWLDNNGWLAKTPTVID
jgi:hypothetical protein